jgi:hypothetical protein
MKMTEAEMLELTASNLEVAAAFMNNYAAHVGIYLSLVFGYCVAAYAAGDKLTRFQVIVASLMFIAAAELQASLMYMWATGAQAVFVSIGEFNPKIGEAEYYGARKVFGISIIQLGILAPLAFMWNVRHPKTE